MTSLSFKSPEFAWSLATCAGDLPAWVKRLADLIETKVGAGGAIVGTVNRLERRGDLCRVAWAYDALRRRTAAALQRVGAITPGTIASKLDMVVSLTGETVSDAQVALTLSIGGRPASELRHSLELAMIAGRGEIEVGATWRRGADTSAATWRCALVEWSIALSADRIAEKMLGLVAVCLDQRGAPQYLSQLDQSPCDVVPLAAHVKPLRDALAQATRRLTNKDQWAISVYQGVDERVLWPAAGGVHLVPPLDRFWADPFLARDGDRLWVFFEELMFDKPKGTIRCIAIESGNRVGAAMDVLEESCHLSYPNVFRHENSWYMLPESSERGDLVLYRARRFPTDWEPVAQLLANVRVVDSTLHRDASGWWLLAGSADSPGATFDDTLHVYRAPTLTGPWTASPHNATRHDPSASRPAGPLFQWNGKWLRPVQDCRGRYGRAVHLLELFGIDEHGPHERLVATISGDEYQGLLCAHTYCRVGRDLALDWQRRRPRWYGATQTRAPALSITTYDPAAVNSVLNSEP